jgi:hypothetical protein
MDRWKTLGRQRSRLKQVNNQEVETEIADAQKFLQENHRRVLRFANETDGRR